MPSKDDVIVIAPGLEQRTSKTGKQRYTVKVSAEPVYVNLSPRDLGKDIAVAIANHLRERVRGITAIAAPATIKARKVAAKAYALGKPWALRRYSGGKTGAKQPDQSNRAFNDSGRFGDSITANAGENSWRVNVAANRLSGPDVSKIWAKLLELVPEFGNLAGMMEQSDILRARVNTAAKMVRKGQMQSAKGALDLLAAGARLFEQVGSLLAG
jgi:hypothetical protein